MPLVALLLFTHLAHAQATLDHATVPATGTRYAVVKVEKFGRYAISATSTRGTSIEVVDRMVGPLGQHGRAGEANGRVDLFLEEGEYRIIARSDPSGTGEARLAVEPFDEKVGPDPTTLVELKSVTDPLGDKEQATYWIEIRGRRSVAFEAVGRHLGDLRLWQDGTWLLPVDPACATAEPVVGKPQTRCLLTATLEPGWYALTAYGAPSAPWTEPGKEQPFWLRWGVPAIGVAGRQRMVIGPTGTDRFLVPVDPRGADRFQVALPANAPVSLGVAAVSDFAPYTGGGSSARITDESRVPVATVTDGSVGSLRSVVVSGPPGQPYLLTWYATAASRTHIGCGKCGAYYVASVHAGFDTDIPDPTAIVVADKAAGPLSQPLELDRKTGYEETFNLLESVQFHVELTDEATWKVATEGTAASVRIEPYFYSKPPGYESPAFARGATSAVLTPGYYLVTVRPETPGIVTVRIGPDTWMGRAAAAVGAAASRPVVARPALQLLGVRDADVDLAAQGSGVGLYVAPYPLVLGAGAPLTLMPGEEVSLPVKVMARGLLGATAEDGEPLPLDVGTGWNTTPVVDAGELTLKVRNPTREPIHASLWHRLEELAPETPLPTLRPAELADALPDFPVLASSATTFSDLVAGEALTWRLDVTGPGLYRFETTGLLATAGEIRTRTKVGFASGSANGVGRNLLVATYLREGDYQATVRTIGASAGHFGLRLDQTRLVVGGGLADGIPARITLPAGDAVAYTFRVAESGSYQIDSLGRGRTFDCRIEDVDGWPLAAPVRTCSVATWLEPGTYRVISLPADVPTQRITQVSRSRAEVVREGHGPHPLPLGATADHTWREPESGDRTPDTWTLDVPAQTTVTLALSEDMAGEILRGSEQIGRLIPGRDWRGTLERGTYTLAVHGARKNDRLAYTIRADAAALVAGTSRTVSLPASLTVAVGATGIVDLASFGSVDVRARLYDSQGRLVAADDDRPDDWNFFVSPRLAPGDYRLELDAVGTGATPTPITSASDEGYGGYASYDEGYGSYDEGYGSYDEGYDSYDEGYDSYDEGYGSYDEYEGYDDGYYGYEEPVATTTVVMSTPAERPEPPLALDAPRAVEPGADVLLVPLAVEPGAELVAVRATADESLAAALDVERDGSWTELASDAGPDVILAARPPAGATGWRLRVRSLDQRGNTASISASTPKIGRLGEGALASGTRVAAGKNAPLGVVALDGDRAGLFALSGSLDGVRVCPAPGEACVPVTASLVPATTDGLWLAARDARVQAKRVVLGATEVVAPVVHPIVADVASGSGPLLVVARSPSGQPGVRLSAGGKDLRVDPLGMGVASNVAVAVDVSGKAAAAVVWSALGSPADVRLRAVRFAAPGWTKADWGTHDGVIAPGAATTIELRGPNRDVRVAVDQGAVVAGQADGAPATWVAADDALELRIARAGDQLVLLNPGDAPARYRIEVLPAGEAPKTLVEAQPFERAFARAGTVSLPVAADGDGRIRVTGNISEALYVRADGAVLRGDAVAVETGGTLLLRHGPGPALAWVERPTGGGPWPADASSKGTRVDGPGVVTLAGPTSRLEAKLGDAAMLHVRAAIPLVARVELPDGTARVAVHPDGAVDAWLPAGEGTVTLRGFGGAALWGEATLTTSTPVDIGEGLGPETLLAPGDTALFRFTTTRSASIGIGVRASADRVSAALLSADGAELGRGLAQMPHLSAGTWLLAVSLPADADPVRARPALAGVVPPDTGPPEDVVRRYLSLSDPTAASLEVVP